MRSKATAKPVVYLISSAGNPNYGDELITAGWLRHYARSLPDAEVWLDTPRPGQTAVLMDGLHPNLRCVDTLFHASWNAPFEPAVDTLDFGGRVISDPHLVPREVTGVENLSRVDLVHILGGGYINQIWPQHLSLIASARSMAAKYGTRTALTGAGLMPLAEGSREPMSALLSRFDVVDVRDEPSRAAVADSAPRVTMTGDDTLMSLAGSRMFGAEGAARTMLCLQSDQLHVGLDQLADYVVRTLRAWGVDQDPMTLVECLPPDDVAVLPLLQEELPQLKVLPFSRLWRSGFPAGQGQRWVSTRFHPHLVAAAVGSWGLAVPISEDYYRTKHESLVELGSGWSVATDLDQPLPAGDPPTAPFSGRLPALRATKQRVAEQVSLLARVGPVR